MLLKKTILLTPVLGSFFICAISFANGVTTPLPIIRDDVHFECKFEKYAPSATDIAIAHHGKCMVEGKLDAKKLHDNKWVCSDRDDELKIHCDGDMSAALTDGEEHEHFLYGRHYEDLLIAGGTTTSPLVVVKDVDDFKNVHRAKLILKHHHEKHEGHDAKDDDNKLEGECRFERKGPLALN